LCSRSRHAEVTHDLLARAPAIRHRTNRCSVQRAREEATMAVAVQAPVEPTTKVQPLIVRITHWVNAVAMVIMIGSGWRIFNDSPLIPGFIFHPDITLGGDVYLSQQMCRTAAWAARCSGTSRASGCRC